MSQSDAGPEDGTVSPDPQAPSLLVELCLREEPDLDDPALLAALRAVDPELDAAADRIVLAHPVEGDDLPHTTVVFGPTSFDAPGKGRPDTGQTWAWPGAQPAVDASRFSVLVVEVPERPSLPPLRRLAALGRVVAALLEVLAPEALHWPHSQRVADPAAFGPDDLDGPVNVRMFSDGDALVMDTVGLSVLGLPDVQCHFRDRAPGEVAELLFVTAVYLVEHGDVVADGDTISHPDGDGRLVCRRERSLLPPGRAVLDVDLGAPWAAGR